MSAQPSSAHLGFGGASPVPTAIVPKTQPLAEDKSNQKRFHGFIAGVFSGVTKLVVGHPFGNDIL